MWAPKLLLRPQVVDGALFPNKVEFRSDRPPGTFLFPHPQAGLGQARHLAAHFVGFWLEPGIKNRFQQLMVSTPGLTR